jgi:hypothetical protein
MKPNPDNIVAIAHPLNNSPGHSEANRIALFAPKSIYDAWIRLADDMKYSAQVKSTLKKGVAPAFGGPVTPSGKHAPQEALSYLQTIPLTSLEKSLQKLEVYAQRSGMPLATLRRHRYHLSLLIDTVRAQGWLPPTPTEGPQFNQFNKPRGQRRTYASDLRITDLKRPDTYQFGYAEAHYVSVEGQRVLGNLTLDQQLQALKTYLESIRKNGRKLLPFVKYLLTFVHEIQGVPLENLTLESLIPLVQLRFSEADFVGHPAFQTTVSGQFIDYQAAEGTLAIAEAMGQRRAHETAETPINILNDFFDWREQVFARFGKSGGLEPSSKRQVISALVLTAEFLYQTETRFKRPRTRGKRRQYTGFHDIPVIVRLRQQYAEHPLTPQASKERIQKTRCVAWPQALVVCENQRRQALAFHCYSRDRSRKEGYVKRQRQLTSIAVDMQKTLILDFSLFIPSDRPQTYRDLRFGHTLKCGQFNQEGEFVSQDIPADPNQAQFWLDLNEFKTAEIYGQFWYPLPNVTFIDNTTFYEFITAWLIGFEDAAGHWPVCYPDDPLWQGYIDTNGRRQGWRAALKPDNHNHFFSQPQAKHPYTEQSFYSVVRAVFARFTQDTGRAVPVAPHSLRHMLSSYLDQLDLSRSERESFAYVMHHSLETQEKEYVYRDRVQRVAPAAERMKQLLRDLSYDT